MTLEKSIHKISDEELVEAIVKTNDTLLFEVLYDRFASMVYNKCYGFANGEDEAKDKLVQKYDNLTKDGKSI